jgi:hypothetical protein
MLRDAGVCDDLAAAVAALNGPIDNLRARRLATKAAWQRIVTDASWDPALPAAMMRRGVAVHEEQVVHDLLADLT